MSKNFGILASISWNSNKWQAEHTKEDIENSNFKWVRENRKSFDDLNFGQEVYPIEKNTYYLGHSPHLTPPPVYENSKFVEIVFFKSVNYHLKKNCIVGFYASPELKLFERAEDNPGYSLVPRGNIKSKPEHIVLFDNFTDMDNVEGILPKGKELGEMGFNYLLYDNVIKILDLSAQLNFGNKIIQSLKFDFLANKKYTALR